VLIILLNLCFADALFFTKAFSFSPSQKDPAWKEDKWICRSFFSSFETSAGSSFPWFSASKGFSRLACTILSKFVNSLMICLVSGRGYTAKDIEPRFP
jgi:hypothetical protein